MAIILDERARAVIARRRSRGGDDRLFLRLERGSLRAGVPWVLVVGWAKRQRQEDADIVQRAGDAEVYMDRRIARYTRSRDLTISGARLGPWQWLVVADPFAFEHMREWEQTHRDVPLPSVSVTSRVSNVPEQDLVRTAVQALPTPIPSGKKTASVGSLSDSGVLASNIGSGTDGPEVRS